jgi:hypothetical protein
VACFGAGHTGTGDKIMSKKLLYGYSFAIWARQVLSDEVVLYSSEVPANNKIDAIEIVKNISDYLFPLHKQWFMQIFSLGKRKKIEFSEKELRFIERAKFHKFNGDFL